MERLCVFGSSSRYKEFPIIGLLFEIGDVDGTDGTEATDGELYT